MSPAARRRPIHLPRGDGSLRHPPRGVLVVVPARNEEQLLGTCLAALTAAVGRAPVPVTVVVVLDTCTDRTAEVAATHRVHSVAVRQGSVGAARAAGVAAGLALLPGHHPASVWISSTDADSRVDPGWIVHQVDLAADGADVVLGTVDLPDEPSTGEITERWRRQYRDRIRGDSHSHVHAANLGIRASTYLSVGGWPPVAADEDVILVHAVRSRPDAVIIPTLACPVSSSARLAGRTPWGVAADLRRIADHRVDAFSPCSGLAVEGEDAG